MSDYHDGTIIYTTRRKPDTDHMAMLLNAEYELKQAAMHYRSMLRAIRAAGGRWGILAAHIQGLVGSLLGKALESVQDEIREAEKEERG